ncbi:hypothetical protein ABEB36_005978 [Hypothenemus hampei]|uniref:Uncharacterized protein n=1 Tax=Hypothenemus hampei TaxID=57062 RepID=A0ABD1F0H6_HYPHA
MDNKRRRKEFHECTKRHQKRMVQESVGEVLNQIHTDSYNGEFNSQSIPPLTLDDISDSDEHDFESLNIISNLEIFNENEFLEEIKNTDGGYYQYSFSENSDNEFDDGSSSEEEKDNLQDDLRDWAVESNTTHKSLNNLLNLLKRYVPKSLLPRDARTLLKTPRKTIVTTIDGGESPN